MDTAEEARNATWQGIEDRTKELFDSVSHLVSPAEVPAIEALRDRLQEAVRVMRGIEEDGVVRYNVKRHLEREGRRKPGGGNPNG